MKNKYVFVTVLLLAVALLGFGFTWGYGRLTTQRDEEELLIVTSFYPMYVATLNVAGGCEGVEVENLSEPQTGCLHDFQLTPQDMQLLSEADVFVVNGGGMESFLTEVASEYPDLVVINAGAAIFGEETSENAHSGHTHSENAHALMSVGYYMEQIEAIRDGLMETDSAHGSYYEEQAEAYLVKIRAFEAEVSDLKAVTAGQPVILFHEAFVYLAEDYALSVEGLLNLDEERQVSAGEVADLIALIERENIQIILAEDLYGRDMGDTIEAETDCRVYYLDTLTRADSAGDTATRGTGTDGFLTKDSATADRWLRGMEENLEILKEAFAAKEEA